VATVAMMGRDIATPIKEVFTKEALMLEPLPCEGPPPAILNCDNTVRLGSKDEKADAQRFLQTLSQGTAVCRVIELRASEVRP
jgi:hypothetical protein